MSLVDWWLDQATSEATATVAKMEEYGSRDLVDIGRKMCEMQHRTEQVTDVVAMEIGCMFYLLGKVARVTSAIERGETASYDTWFDISVYAKMVLAARQGAWKL